MNVNVMYLIFFPLPGQKAGCLFLRHSSVLKKDINLQVFNL